MNEEQGAIVEASGTSKQFETANQNTTKRKNIPATEAKQAEKLQKN